MRFCAICEQKMFSSMTGKWIKNKFYNIHSKCIEKTFKNAINNVLLNRK